MLRGREYEDEDEELDGEDFEEGDDQRDDDGLADLPEEYRGAVDAAIARERTNTLAETRRGLRDQGLDLSDDFRPVVREHSKAAGFLGIRQDQSLSKQDQQQSAVTRRDDEEDDDGEWADPAIDGDKFERRLTKTLERVIKPLVERNQELEGMVLEDRIEGTMARVPEAIEKYAPYLVDAMEHEQFEAMFREGLRQMPPSQWRDPRNLAKLAGVIAPHLYEDNPDLGRRAGRGRRSEPEERQRPDPRAAQRAALSKAAVGAAAPSRGGGGVGRDQGSYSDVEKETSRRLGISLKAVRALAEDPSGEKYAAQLEAEAKAKGGRR